MMALVPFFPLFFFISSFLCFLSSFFPSHFGGLVLCFFATPGCTQGLLPVLHSGITPDRFIGLYEVPGIEYRLVTCKTSTLSAGLSHWSLSKAIFWPKKWLAVYKIQGKVAMLIKGPFEDEFSGP